MKRIISLAICIAMSAMLFVPSVFAQQDTTEMQNVLKTVKERITVPENLTEFNFEKNSNDYETVYRFDWRPKDNGNNESLYVSCTTEGIITNYNYYSDSNYKSTQTMAFPDISLSDAKEKAKAFVKQVNPTIYDKLEIIDDGQAQNLYSSGYNFQFRRVENGIPFDSNRGYIRLNNSGDKVFNFDITWSSYLKFPDPSKAISKEEAVKAFNEKLGLELVYKAYYTNDGKYVYPAYVLKEDGNKAINALNGEVVQKGYPISIYSRGGGMMQNAKIADAAPTPFTKEELEKIDIHAGLLSPEQATAIIKANKIIKFSNELVLTSQNLYRDYNNKEEYIYTLNFNKPNQNSPEKVKTMAANDTFESLSVTMNAKTGEIKSFYRSKEHKNTEQQISSDKAKAIAKTAFDTLAGDKAKEFELKANYQSEYGIALSRKVNGIPYVDNMATIEIDSIDGEVSSYNINYTKDKFPSIDGVLTPQQAAEKLFGQLDYHLAYAPNYNQETGKADAKIIAPTLPIKGVYLVYDVDYFAGIEPFSGSILGYDGKVTAVNKPKKYTDIEGHYAQKQIERLAEFGVTFDGDEFKPDSPILQKDYVAILSMVFRGNGPYVLRDAEQLSNVYRMFINDGIVKESEKNPDGNVTREDAAKFLVRALGIDEYASIEGIYNCPFSDVNEFKGHISILSGMGVIKGDSNGNFNPKNILTRADAMIIIYNYLAR